MASLVYNYPVYLHVFVMNFYTKNNVKLVDWKDNGIARLQNGKLGRCALSSSLSVSALFYGHLNVHLHESAKSRNRRSSH